MGIDRPSRSSEDDDQRRRAEQKPAKPSEQDDAKPAGPSRSERSQSQAERARDAKQRAVEAYRDRHNSMTAAERRQVVRDKHAQYLEEETKRKNRTPAEVEAEAKAYLEQRKARIEAYERGDLPRSQLSRSERHDATQRKFDRFVAAEKAKEERAATGADRVAEIKAEKEAHPAAERERDRPEGVARTPEQTEPRQPGTSEAADARSEARECAERQAEHADKEEGPDNYYAAPYSADSPDAKPAERGSDQSDQPQPATERPAEEPERSDEPAPFDWSMFGRVPERTGERTSGMLANVDGTALWEKAQSSGRDGPSKDVGEKGLRISPRMMVATHVEAHATAAMRQTGTREATLYLNRETCPYDRDPVKPQNYPMSCDALLPRMLEPGAKLTVYGPNGFVRVYHGLTDEELRQRS